jgi:Rrf2 family transcriptional regulator, nitric oxide-sensitive transcriptional repressor
MLSQTAEYALRAIVFLSQTEDQPRTTRQIAQATQVKQQYLSKVLQGLRRAGLVSARPGAGGGFQITRTAAEITVLDVVESVEPLPRITECPLGLAAHEAQLCLLHARLDSAMNAVETVFRETSIAELLPSKPPVSRRCPFPNRPASDRFA